MKRQPYTKEEKDAIVAQGEVRLGVHNFIDFVIEPVVVGLHPEECRCTACIHAYLEAMEKRSAEYTAQLEENQIEEINYVG